jgi:hypothetical protein
MKTRKLQLSPMAKLHNETVNKPQHTPTETKCHQTRYGNPNCPCVHCQKLDESRCVDCKQLIIGDLTDLLKAMLPFVSIAGHQINGRPAFDVVKEAIAKAEGVTNVPTRGLK